MPDDLDQEQRWMKMFFAVADACAKLSQEDGIRVEIAAPHEHLTFERVTVANVMVDGTYGFAMLCDAEGTLKVLTP